MSLIVHLFLLSQFTSESFHANPFILWKDKTMIALNKTYCDMMCLDNLITRTEKLAHQLYYTLFAVNIAL